MLHHLVIAARTGKTTIARHYGLFLQQLLVLPEGSVFQETSGAKLIQGGVNGLQELLEEVKGKGGGVIFVDEAYQLASDQEGKKVLDFILPLAESLDTGYGSLAWVFAGYKTPLEKLFEYDERSSVPFSLQIYLRGLHRQRTKKDFLWYDGVYATLAELVKKNEQKNQKTPSPQNTGLCILSTFTWSTKNVSKLDAMDLRRILRLD